MLPHEQAWQCQWARLLRSLHWHGAHGAHVKGDHGLGLNVLMTLRHTDGVFVDGDFDDCGNTGHVCTVQGMCRPAMMLQKAAVRLTSIERCTAPYAEGSSSETGALFVGAWGKLHNSRLHTKHERRCEGSQVKGSPFGCTGEVVVCCRCVMHLGIGIRCTVPKLIKLCYFHFGELVQPFKWAQGDACTALMPTSRRSDCA